MCDRYNHKGLYSMTCMRVITRLCVHWHFISLHKLLEGFFFKKKLRLSGGKEYGHGSLFGEGDYRGRFTRNRLCECDTGEWGILKSAISNP